MTTEPHAATTLSPQIVGQAEKAHRPVLDRILAPTGITMNQWVALKLTAIAGPGNLDQLAGRITGTWRIDDASARAAIADLTAAGLFAQLSGDAGLLGFTDAGQALYDQINGAVDEVISRAYADIPVADLMTAGLVLIQITAKLNAEQDLRP
jgi:hypothetical protein